MAKLVVVLLLTLSSAVSWAGRPVRSSARAHASDARGHVPRVGSPHRGGIDHRLGRSSQLLLVDRQRRSRIDAGVLDRFLGPPATGSPSTDRVRDAFLARYTKDGRFTVRISPAGRQLRIARLTAALSARVQRTHPEASAKVPPVVVIEGPGADTFNAVALSSDLIVIHRAVLEVADRVGIMAATASNSEQLLEGMYRVAVGRDRMPAAYPRARARRYADAFISAILAHELVHVLESHATKAAGASLWSERRRGFEDAADAGGLRRTIDAGYRPGEAALAFLYLALYNAANGEDGVTFSDHPGWRARVPVIYKVLRRLGAALDESKNGRASRSRRAAEGVLDGLPSAAATLRAAETAYDLYQVKADAARWQRLLRDPVWLANERLFAELFNRPARIPIDRR